MNRGVVLTSLTVALWLCHVNVLYSASFGDMFGGKKKQKNMLAQKDQECQSKLNLKDREYQRLINEGKDAQDTAVGLRNKNSTLMKAYEKLKNDQNAVMEQLNRLRRDSQRCQSVKESLEQMTQENQAFLDGNKSLEETKKVMMATLDSLKLHIRDLTAENEQLRFVVEEAQEDEHIKVKKIRNKVKNELKSLKSRITSLSKENDILAEQLKDIQRKNHLLSADILKTQQESDYFKGGLASLEKEHAAMKDENRQLAKEASEFPKKFTDLARHNQKLVRDTAHMHYNMGVSFIKSEEYKRAVKEFKKVLELNPKDAYANYNLGYIYAQHLVDRPAAVKHFQTYLAYAKGAKDADWVKKYILTWQTWYAQEKSK